MPILDFDANATTPILPAARNAMLQVLADNSGNASSAHALGRQARQALEDARERIAAALGAKPREVVFVSGATEANNLALMSETSGPTGSILANPTEHPCVIEPLRVLAGRGVAVDWLPVDSQGRIDPGEVRRRIQPATRMIVVQRANHETGTVQPVEMIAKFGVAVHCDAAQAVGKIPVHFAELGCATMSLSAHKFRGPPGIGALIIRDGATVKPMLFGGHQERGVRPGTESPFLAAGMAVALEHAVRTMTETTARIIRLRERLWSELQATAGPVIWNARDTELLPNTLNVSFPGCRSDLLLMALDLAGVACSTGSACSSGSLLPSPVLQAMQVPTDRLTSAMRLSLGESTTDAEIEAAITIISDCVRRLRSPMQ
jgi:cysteine desulfurase